MRFKITTLIENNPGDDPLLYSEHGLSFHIQMDGINILFDTGQSGNFIENAEKLNVDLNKLDYVIISHGHYDHSGGFKRLAESSGASFKLILGEGFFNSKYKLVPEGDYKYIGNAFDEAYVNSRRIPITYVGENIFEISENAIIFSNFQRQNDFEIPNKKFFVKKNDRYEADKFSDEIALAIKLKEGLFVVLGCSHVGVVNILETIMQKTNMPIFGIVGGTHLIEADESRLRETAGFFKRKNIRLIGMSHCTGEEAVKEFQKEFHDSFFYNKTGSVFAI